MIIEAILDENIVCILIYMVFLEKQNQCNLTDGKWALVERTRTENDLLR